MLGCIGPPQYGHTANWAAATGDTVIPHGRVVGVPSGSSDRKHPTRPIAVATGIAST